MRLVPLPWIFWGIPVGTRFQSKLVLLKLLPFWGSLAGAKAVGTG